MKGDVIMLQKMQLDNLGRLKKTRSNYRLALSTSEQWRGKIRHNNLTDRYELWNCIDYEEWSDSLDIMLCEWFEFAHDIKPSKNDIIDARIRVGLMQSYDPLYDWCRSLVWDGQPRINTWLRTYLNGEGSDDYIMYAGRSVMLGAASRALYPGCEFDLMLVLIGPQGCGKSRSCKALAPWPELYTDSVPDISSAGTDAETVLQGKSIVEMAELEALRRADLTTLKAYISRPVADIRKKYARTEGRYPRRCIFIGTGNRSQFLKDSTGNRRFIPLHVNHCRVKALERDRTQLWAEAIHILSQNDSSQAVWRLNPRIDAELEEKREEAMEIDPWYEMVEEWLAHHPVRLTKGCVELTTREIFTECPFFTHLNPSQINRAAEMRLSDILKSLGYKKLPQRRYKDRTYRKWLIE